MSKTSAPPAIAATEHVTPISAEAAAAYTVDGRAPACIAAPESVVQLQEILTTAQNVGQHVIPVGGGAHLHLGNPPDAYDLALSAARLNRIIAHEPADIVDVLTDQIHSSGSAKLDHGVILTGQRTIERNR